VFDIVADVFFLEMLRSMVPHQDSSWCLQIFGHSFLVYSMAHQNVSFLCSISDLLFVSCKKSISKTMKNWGVLHKAFSFYLEDPVTQGLHFHSKWPKLSSSCCLLRKKPLTSSPGGPSRYNSRWDTHSMSNQQKIGDKQSKRELGVFHRNGYSGKKYTKRLLNINSN
jgi:hypothetical protein